MKSASSSNSRASMNCKCKTPSILRTVKVGDNVGKKFYGCGRWPNANCGFFLWDTVESLTSMEEVEVGKTMQLEENIMKLKTKNQKLKELIKGKDDALEVKNSECTALKIKACNHAKGERLVVGVGFDGYLPPDEYLQLY